MKNIRLAAFSILIIVSLCTAQAVSDPEDKGISRGKENKTSTLTPPSSSTLREKAAERPEPQGENKSRGQQAVEALNKSLSRGNASNASIKAREINIERIQNKTELRLAEAYVNGTRVKVWQTGRVSVKTALTLSDVSGMLALDNKTLRIQPDDLATEEIQVKDSELLDDKGRLVYRLRVKTERRVLWVLPVSSDDTLDVDAETGEVKEYSRPWWSFLDTSGALKKYKEVLRGKSY